LYKQAIDDFDKAIRLKPAYVNAGITELFPISYWRSKAELFRMQKKACELGNC
jgi:hypothetical protein